MIDSAETLLPPPRLAHQAESFAGLEIKADAFDNVDDAFLGVETDGKLFDFEQSGPCVSGSPARGARY